MHSAWLPTPADSVARITPGQRKFTSHSSIAVTQLTRGIMGQSPKITTGFNVLLILYSAAIGVFTFAVSDAAQDIPVEGIIMTSLVDFVRFLLMMFVTAYFTREIWNRLISDLFDVRVIAYREAITFVVVLGLLLS